MPTHLTSFFHPPPFLTFKPPLHYPTASASGRPPSTASTQPRRGPQPPWPAAASWPPRTADAQGTSRAARAPRAPLCRQARCGNAGPPPPPTAASGGARCSGARPPATTPALEPLCVAFGRRATARSRAACAHPPPDAVPRGVLQVPAPRTSAACPTPAQSRVKASARCLHRLLRASAVVRAGHRSPRRWRHIARVHLLFPLLSPSISVSQLAPVLAAAASRCPPRHPLSPLTRAVSLAFPPLRLLGHGRGRGVCRVSARPHHRPPRRRQHGDGNAAAHGGGGGGGTAAPPPLPAAPPG